MKASSLTPRVVDCLRRFDPAVRVTLFGSRARGEAHATSDWDFLVQLSIPVTPQLRRAIRDALYDIELDTGELISTIIHEAKDSARYAATPLYQNIGVEGIVVR